jgi:putative ABC transport system permease protein
MKIPIVRGRSFADTDVEGAPDVVMINQAFGRRYLPGQEPLGKKISLDGNRWMEIVGVTKDGKYRTLGEEPRPYVYLPLYQHYQPAATVVLRLASNSANIQAMARGEIGRLDKSLPVFDVKSGEDHMKFALLPARLAGTLLGALGTIALALAAIGIYGVMSFMVAQRTREIGIRVALGAQKRNVLGLVIGHGMSLALAGMLIGIIAAAAITRFAAMFLYGISPTDPLTFVGIAGLLGSVAFLACYIPARRATGVDPMIALRYE